jgi:hypothetical protein
MSSSSAERSPLLNRSSKTVTSPLARSISGSSSITDEIVLQSAVTMMFDIIQAFPLDAPTQKA